MVTKVKKKKKMRRVNSMENLWETIAKARGVAIDEEFLYSLGNFEYKYRISERGLEYYDNDGDWWSLSTCSIEFIKGIGKIERLPFRPKIDDSYFTIINENEVIISLWQNRSIDYTRLIAGVVFRTREEAEAYIPTWIERINKL